MSEAIGDRRMVPLLDGVMALDTLSVFSQLSPSDWALHPEFLSPSGTMVMPYGGFLIDSPFGGNVLVDVGGGPAFEVPRESGELVQAGMLPSALEELGVEPDSIDFIVLTHLHSDHIGWLAPDGVPYFRNAEIYCHLADWNHFVDTPDPPDALIPQLLSGCADQMKRWDGASISVGGLTLQHVPGHTPGSVIVIVPGPGAAVIGDLVHSPVEFLESWDGLADVDPALASKTRNTMIDDFISSGTTLWGTHFPAMRPGRLSSDAIRGIMWTPCGCQD
jgi:glyoxylase-like metal-dependent hydrolase (beta-lactamase superfamily II)